jgi:hypothetical protein
MVHVVIIVTMVKRFTKGIIVTSVLFQRDSLGPWPTNDEADCLNRQERKQGFGLIVMKHRG